MPARTVVVGRMSNGTAAGGALIPNEFQQMAGRAGRRGMDPFGHVVVPYSPWFTFRETLDIATGELHPVQSAFAIRYNTVLNLWDPPHASGCGRSAAEPRPVPEQPAHSRAGRSDHRHRRGDRANPQGCLIGLEAGDELLEDYRRANRSSRRPRTSSVAWKASAPVSAVTW